tara:strand:+ start:662 stop:1198 length:537 start_codon:yes stop_codon:yes gene_type:complete
MIFIKKNIVMVGMTGVGKTTIGKVLSKKLKKKFFDIDFEIENASGLKIADLFSEYGEKEFRKIEKKIIVKILNDYSEAIISTGAGIFNNKKINNLILKKSICVFLKAKKKTLYNRLKNNLYNRPKLTIGKLEDNIEEMYKNRIKNYNRAHIIVEVDHLSINEVSSLIIENLAKYEEKT